MVDRNKSALIALFLVFVLSFQLCAGMIINPYRFTVAGVSFVYDLKCEDDAATTDINNDGTGGTVAFQGRNTSQQTDAVNFIEGTRSFIVDQSGCAIQTANNWTSEQFEVTFYYRPTNATSTQLEPLVCIDDGDFLPDPSNMFLYRTSGTNDLTIVIQGATGGSVSRTSTNVTWVANTWYEITLTVDATANPWVINVDWGGTTVTWTGSSWNADAATFNDQMLFMGIGATFFAVGNVDWIRVEDQE